MNLRSIANSVTQAINPNLLAIIQFSTGYTTNADGTQVPAYTTVTGVSVQVQALTGKDLRQAEGAGLNLNGTLRAIYMNGQADGVVRSQLKGGDLIILTGGPNAGTWLVTQVAEPWTDWVHYIVTLQND